MTRACLSRLFVAGSILLLPSFMIEASDWHAFTKASPATVREETSRLAVSESKSDRLLAAELLGRFPLYFSSEIYLSLVTRLISDENQGVREQTVSALFDVADGGLPTESREQQTKLLKSIAMLLQSVRSKPGYDVEMIDGLLVKLKGNSLFKVIPHQ